MTTYEVNFDGLIGPTHHYGGLSQGNLASTEHRHSVSSPRSAALQGLAKMKRVADMGIPQAFLPPQFRPDLPFLEEHGFAGSPQEIVSTAYQERPDLLSIAYSASAMWTANAATVSPSSDCVDGRVHFTPANLQTMPHRALEARNTTKTLRSIFHDANRFEVHDPLPSVPETSDEGAANHTRFCRSYDSTGVELFVFGRDGDNDPSLPRFPARQTRAACDAIASTHGLNLDRCVFAHQHPNAIDAGVFHNDVISVGNQTLHLVHQFAFADQDRVLADLADCFGPGLQQVVVPDHELPLADAVQSYFFNSQLISTAPNQMLLLCPIECSENEPANQIIASLLMADNPIRDCQFVDLRESMQNGGGPACLRLRVVLTEDERAAIPESVFLTDRRYHELCDWVRKHYRDRLTVSDLKDESLFEEVSVAMQELHAMLDF
ncbi:N-succinylarginine dihydrolase [Blastopirellula marina]|uniref:N-succinylarginine dihydrolase n=1 Tax=Blastopirellula marina TaxID=124 RepID=A0A2S8F0Q9_9BACT|nr:MULTISPECIES: N-succinylarginine dihydrolase [Pirellulaceae]PQO25762.1 N-succinylarginine dihydrolase [Blastopirellula marina]RCS43445.1 N-succinylarginine dihydrolase [Bremerella cremea]